MAKCNLRPLAFRGGVVYNALAFIWRRDFEREGRSALMKPKTVNLTEGSITKCIIEFAVPILLTNLLQQLYNSIDSAVLGQFCGDDALAAVGATGALINVLIGFFLGLATGAGILYAMYYGAGDHKSLRKLIDSSLVLSLAIGVVMTAVGVVFTRELLSIMEMPQTTLDLSEEYLRIYMGGTVITLIYNVGAGLIRAEGDSMRPLIYLAIGGVGNLVMDIVAVAWLGMGVAGAAWATVIAQTITAVLVVIRLCRLDPAYALRPLHMKPDKLILRDVIAISIPCGLQSSMYNISNLLVQIKINTFGTVAMAGVTAYGKIDAFVYMPMEALSLAISTFVGQNIGAGKYERMKKAIRVCLVLCLASCVVIGGLIIAFFEPLMHIFTGDEEAIAFGRTFLGYLLPFVWIYSFVDIFSGAIRGSGQATQVTIISALSICVFRIVWIELLLPVFSDIRVVFLCYPTSWVLCAALMVWYYYRRSSLRRAMLANAAASAER